MKGKKTIVIHARLDKATYVKVKKLAELYKVNISTIMRLLVNASLGDNLAQTFFKTKPTGLAQTSEPIEPTESLEK